MKNHNLGLEVPYRYGSSTRTYIPDFIVQVDDASQSTVNIVVEIKGYRGEDAKVKKDTMETFWIPGVNNLGSYGHWTFAEFTDVYEIEREFDEMVRQASASPRDQAASTPATGVKVQS